MGSSQNGGPSKLATFRLFHFKTTQEWHIPSKKTHQHMSPYSKCTASPGHSRCTKSATASLGIGGLSTSIQKNSSIPVHVSNKCALQAMLAKSSRHRLLRRMTCSRKGHLPNTKDHSKLEDKALASQRNQKTGRGTGFKGAELLDQNHRCSGPPQSKLVVCCG